MSYRTAYGTARVRADELITGDVALFGTTWVHIHDVYGKDDLAAVADEFGKDERTRDRITNLVTAGDVPSGPAYVAVRYLYTAINQSRTFAEEPDYKVAVFSIYELVEIQQSLGSIPGKEDPPPPPRPKHQIIPIGTRVLVHPTKQWEGEDEFSGTAHWEVKGQPYYAKVAGYDMYRTKYQLHAERHFEPGRYYEHIEWAFADDRVMRADDPSLNPPTTD